MVGIMSESLRTFGYNVRGRRGILQINRKSSDETTKIPKDTYIQMVMPNTPTHLADEVIIR